MSNLLACPSCRSLNPDGSRFCGQCGKPLAATSARSRGTTAQSTAVYHTEYGPAPHLPGAGAGAGPGRSHGVLTAEELDAAVQTATRTFGQSVLYAKGPSLGGGGPLEVAIEHQIHAVDRSGSVGDYLAGGRRKIDAIHEAVCEAVSEKARLDSRDRVGVVDFDHDARLICPLTELVDPSAVVRAVRSLSPRGGTRFASPLRVAEGTFDWSVRGVVRRVTLLSDGKAHDGDDARDAADRLKDRGVIIDTIGFAASPDLVDQELLEAIASVVDGRKRYAFFSDAKALTSHATRVLGTKTATLP